MGIPFIAINRPGYVDSSPIPPTSQSTTYCQAEGHHLHTSILPALWAQFGPPNSCTSLILTCHSMAVLGGIVLGNLYARDPSPRYPLAGLILSGSGTRPITHEQAPSVDEAPINVSDTDKFYFPPAVKRDLMFGLPAYSCVDSALIPLLEAQNTYMLHDELVDLRIHWSGYRASYAQEIEVPVMYALGERDWLFEATKETVAEFAALFPKSPRVDASLVLDAPHALVWSWGGHGWYARCFGWAVEVCASYGVGEGMKL